MSNKVVDLGAERPSREGLHPERKKWLTSMWVNFDRGQQRVIIIPREPPCLSWNALSLFYSSIVARHTINYSIRNFLELSKQVIEISFNVVSYDPFIFQME